MKFRNEVEIELLENILPFWTRKTVDRDNGGFVGRILGNGDYDWRSNKGVTLNSQILWSFSAVYSRYRKRAFYELATNAYQYLTTHFFDKEFGGSYSMVDSCGNPVESTKNISDQAYVINGLAEYYKVSQNAEVLSQAIEMYNLIEIYGFDKGNPRYLESLSREWERREDIQRKHQSGDAILNLKTHLHLLEAYTNLTMAWDNEKLKDRLKGLVHLFLETLIDEKTCHIRMIFNHPASSVWSKISYGHDIKTSWLLCKAAHVVSDYSLSRQVELRAVQMTEVSRREAFGANGGLRYENISGRVNQDVYWWAQAGAVVGFINSFRLTGNPEYLDDAWNSWQFIRTHLIDRVNGDWHTRVNQQGTPYDGEDKVSPFKSPYHQTMACLELLERIDCCLKEN